MIRLTRARAIPVKRYPAKGRGFYTAVRQMILVSENLFFDFVALFHTSSTL